MANPPWLQGRGERQKEEKEPGFKAAPDSLYRDVPSADSSVPPVLAWDPSILALFPCCYTSLLLPHPSPSFSLGTLESGRVGSYLEICRGWDADCTALSPNSFWVKIISSTGLEQHQARGDGSKFRPPSHTNPSDKVGEAWRKTPCPHPGARSQRRMSVSIPPVNGNSQSLLRAVISPQAGGRGCFSLSGLHSRFPVLPFDLLAHSPSLRGCPTGGTPDYGMGLCHFSSGRAGLAFSCEGLFLVLVLHSLAGSIPEKPCGGDAAKILRSIKTLGQTDGSQEMLGNQPWSLCPCGLMLRDNTQALGRGAE